MKQEIKQRIEKIRKGEVPEGYKKTEIGIIPEDWDVKNLSTLGKFHKGKGISHSEIINEGNKCLTYGDIYTKFSTVVKNIKSFVNDESAKNSFELQKGDFLFAGSGETQTEIGKCILYDSSDKAYAGGDIVILRTKKMKGLFFAYALNSEIFFSQTRRIGQGYSVVHIYANQLKKVLIPITSEIEQEKIADILSTWDKAIELKEKLLEEKKNLKKGFVENLIFGRFRFSNFIKSKNYKHQKYYNLPEDWDFIQIKEIAKEVSQKNGTQTNLPVLSCTKYSGLVDSLEYFKKQIFSKDLSPYKKVKRNNFVYATNHIDEGSIGYQNLYECGLVSPMYTVFETNSRINNKYLFTLLKTNLYIFLYNVQMSASVNRRGSLRWNEFKKIKIPLPPIEEQNKIAKVLNLIDQEIKLLKSELEQIKEQKKGLMQLLLTGIVRVKTGGESNAC